MRINSSTKIISDRIILVPYREYHVPRYKAILYHEWMKSEDLRALTASEPLTLEEEYHMQKSWQEDEDKCTFIILDKNSYENNHDEIESMIGDTNIFVTDRELEIGEIEIMIAEESSRGKGLGFEAVVLMLLYGVNFLHLKCFEAKISLSNVVSIKMFVFKLQFEEKSVSEVFQEVTLERKVTDEWLTWLTNTICFQIQTC